MRVRLLVLAGTACVGLAIHLQTRAFVPAPAAGVAIFYSPAGAAIANAALGIGAVIGALWTAGDSLAGGERAVAGLAAGTVPLLAP